MLDIPIGKAVIAVLRDVQCNDECADADYQCPIDCCKGCVLTDKSLGGIYDNDPCGALCCVPGFRKDGKHVLFKLIDYPLKK
jgi:hypothetical protein